MLRLFVILTDRQLYQYAMYNPANSLQVNYNFHIELIINWK